MFSQRGDRVEVELDAESRMRLYWAASRCVDALRGQGRTLGAAGVLYDIQAQLRGLPPGMPDNSRPFWGAWEERIQRRHGQSWLGNSAQPYTRIASYFQVVAGARVLDAVEFFLDVWADTAIPAYRGATPLTLDSVGDAFNQALEDSELDYRVIGTIVAPAAPFIAEEVLDPAMRALRDRGVTGGLDEFATALRAFRGGDLRRVLSEARSAVESAMKAALTRLGAGFDATATACPLVEALRAENFFVSAPGEDLFGPIGQNILQSAPSIANRLASHGHGAVSKEITPATAALALHVSAAAILYLDSRTTEMLAP